MKRYTIADLAWQDLMESALFIGENNQKSAVRFIDAAHRSFENVAAMPRIGTVYEAVSQAFHGMRWFPIDTFKNFLIFYVSIERGIKIIRVIHSSRDIEKIFEVDGPQN